MVFQWFLGLIELPRVSIIESSQYSSRKYHLRRLQSLRIFKCFDSLTRCLTCYIFNKGKVSFCIWWLVIAVLCSDFEMLKLKENTQGLYVYKQAWGPMLWKDTLISAGEKVKTDALLTLLCFGKQCNYRFLCIDVTLVIYCLYSDYSNIFLKWKNTSLKFVPCILTSVKE